MRKVATYSMAAKAAPGDIADANDAVTEEVELWLESKGKISLTDGVGTIQFPDGRAVKGDGVGLP